MVQSCVTITTVNLRTFSSPQKKSVLGSGHVHYLINRRPPGVCCAYSPSRARLSVTPWTVAHQASLSMGFSRQEDWSALPCPSQWDLPDLEIEPGSPALQADSLPAELPGNSPAPRHSQSLSCFFSIDLPILDILDKRNIVMWCFVSCFFTWHVSRVLTCYSMYHSFLWPNNTPLYKYATFTFVNPGRVDGREVAPTF